MKVSVFNKGHWEKIILREIQVTIQNMRHEEIYNGWANWGGRHSGWWIPVYNLLTFLTSAYSFAFPSLSMTISVPQILSLELSCNVKAARLYSSAILRPRNHSWYRNICQYKTSQISQTLEPRRNPHFFWGYRKAIKNKETENRIYEERFNLEDGQSI